MLQLTIAIPSDSTEGLDSTRSDHFGHCPAFTLIDLKGGEISNVRAVTNVAHAAGGCMKPVVMLAENGVKAMIATGMGNGPFQKMQQHGIEVFYADMKEYPDVQSTVNGFINGKLQPFAKRQLCTNSGGDCHHLPTAN